MAVLSVGDVGVYRCIEYIRQDNILDTAETELTGATSAKILKHHVSGSC